ncbi:sterol regulatory element-binding protein cleavage-activating protein [Euwallacea similis]|uniref:sterol regulatory element-binding protein cleavage-activating protein n=1 Tax=Euwallacea similis TaxID=1736056 RepID=UPI00344D0BD8
MSLRGERPLNRGSCNRSTIQEKVATLFYSIGLLCSSYPTLVLVFAISVIIGCCLPLAHIPLPLTAPKEEWVATGNVTHGQAPFCYIQQVVLKVAVLPWEPDLTLGDGFRAPLYESFKLLDIVRNYQDKNSLKTLGHVCLHIEAVAQSKVVESSPIMPQYSCLVLSPANFWHQDVNEFSQDSTILTTIFNQHRYHKGKMSMAEILFGMHMRDTGIKRYPLRHRQRIIQFAVTLFYKEFDKGFIVGLHDKLSSLYPLHQDKTFSTLSNDTLVINYPEEIDYYELFPVVCAFLALFLYYYFYVRKVDEIKSKAGMSFAATITVLCSLLMTMGISLMFGLTVNTQKGKWIFPYLAILFGLENVLVLTKSVLMTPQHLDAKIRLAQGLSKEGWSATKNLLIEITVFTFGLFTFVPVIQEFCVFALVSILAGLFLQILFFSTILGVDLNRASTTLEKSSQSFRNALYQPLIENTNRGMSRSRSHPRLSFPANIVVATGQKHSSSGQEKKIPKRLMVVNVWARTRFFQRSFMVLMVIWICMIVYNSDIINLLTSVNDQNHPNQTKSKQQLPRNYLNLNFFPSPKANLTKPSSINYVTYNPLDVGIKPNQSGDLEKLKPCEYAPWLRLPASHWSGILRNYNVSLGGQSLAILPSIKLAHVISPEQAVSQRNPEEKYGSKLQWQALALALDPIDFNGDDFPSIDQMEQPLYPRSPMEIMLLSILILISVIVMTYGFVVLYRCVCSRNYAEWRASWYPEKAEEASEPEQVMLEAVPVVLEGHIQEVECIASDGAHLASICLGGQLKIWDNSTGELVAVIDRKQHLGTDSESPGFSLDNDDLSDYESGSPPSRDEVFPLLINRISSDFSNLKLKTVDNDSFNAKYEFYKAYKFHYGDDGTRFSFGSRRISSDEKYTCETNSRKNSNGAGRLSSVWCMDYVDNLVIVGCADGRLEFWEATSCKLKCVFEDGNDSGVTNVKLIGSRVVAARLCGSLDFLQLQTYTQGRPVDWNFTCAYRRTHIRTGSMGSISERDIHSHQEDLRCIKIISVRAHQQPITCVDCEGGRIVTGSQDHTLKVHRVETGDLLYTLHGHCGPITCLFIDRVCPATSGSGSQDGMLCVWDLLSGTCMYSIQAHDGCITSLTYSASYVISLGIDERLCVWERFQGHLLNSILVGQVFSNHILMLAPHLVITGRNGGLVIWDVRHGECVRTISLGRDPFVFIKQLILLRDAVLCDYGKQLRIVRFPLITHKFD